MGKMINFSCLTLILFLAGCTQYWYQEGKSFRQVRQDCRDCRIEADRYADADSRLGGYRAKFERNCMKEQGYRLVSENSLPLRSKRRSPDVLYGENYGIAGCLDDEVEEMTEVGTE